jgi:hypothetical protein
VHYGNSQYYYGLRIRYENQWEFPIRGREWEIPSKIGPNELGNPNGKWYLREVGESWEFPMVLPPKD